ncbi:MAG: hypothetical protein WAL45_09880 [Terracidiphilus sp.]
MLRSTQSRHCAGRDRPQAWFRCRRGYLCLLACCAAVALAAGAGLLRAHAQSTPTQAAAPPQNVASAPAPAAGQQEPSATGNADDARKQQIASECADLLKMATDLKTEVDKSTKDMLSVGVVRKAGQIEQLARKVRTGSP